MRCINVNKIKEEKEEEIKLLFYGGRQLICD